MKIVTGRTGTPHVTSQEQRDIYSAIFGNSNVVLNIGKCLKAELQASNTVRVYDGVLVMQGCVATIDAGAYDDVRIDNGTQGQKRIDLIVAHYKNNTGTGYESVELEVVKGKSDAKPIEPSVPAGEIRNGSNDAYFSLYAVKIDGVNIQKLEPKFETLNTYMQNPKVLWQGAHYMDPTQIIKLSEKISNQNSGIVLVFSAFDSNTSKPKEYNYHYFFVPKTHIQKHNGSGVSFGDAYEKLSKYLYISDDSIKGYSENDKNGTKNGIPFENKGHVLRYVVGV